MAIKKTTVRTNQEAATSALHTLPSFHEMQSAVHIARFDYTLDGAEVTGDDLELGSLGLANVEVIPELSRICDTTAANDMGADFTLESVNPDTLAVTALSAATTWANNSVAFTRLASGAQPTIAGANDFLQVAITSPTGASGTTYVGVEGDTITILIAYRVLDFA